MLIPQYLILSVMIIIGIFPGYFINISGSLLNSSIFSNMTYDLLTLNPFMTVMRNISLSSILFLVITGIVFFIRRLLTRKNERKYSSTWGCAYVAPTNRMQYTGKSYSKSFGKLLNFIMIEKKGYSEIEKKEIFPDSRKYHSSYLDIFESKIIEPATYIFTRFINLFQFVQNGKIQAYVIYGIVFILSIFIGTILNIIH